MRFTLFATFLVILSQASASFAQSEGQLTRLKSKFSAQDVALMEKQDPTELAYWDFYTKKGFVVFKIDGEKGSSGMEVIHFSGDIANINPLELSLEPKETEVQAFALGDTGHGILILSRKKILAKMARKN